MSKRKASGLREQYKRMMSPYQNRQADLYFQAYGKVVIQNKNGKLKVLPSNEICVFFDIEHPNFITDDDLSKRVLI